MARTLDVYLHRHFCGHLLQDDHGRLRFKYAESWLNDPRPMALSHSLPLRPAAFTSKECQGFFGGILPEGDKREIAARNLGISPRNDFAMLDRIGGECAGAVTFLPAGTPLPEQKPRYLALSEKHLAETLRTLPRHPLLAGETEMRLSLAGAQDKLPVLVAGPEIFLPLDGSPSTHILKPAIERFPGSVHNEALCLRLAQAIGLPAAPVETRSVEGIDYLLVERYDRKVGHPSAGGPPLTERLHQEDLCQALAVISERKYQNEGGPSLKQCFALVREVSSIPVLDLQNLLDAVIFNFLVGNNDAHGKNFSFTYDIGPLLGGQPKRLAPVYDILCTAYYPDLSSNMAMTIGGEYNSREIRPRHFERMAEDTGLTKPLVRRRVVEMAGMILAQLPDLSVSHPVSQQVAKVIQERCERTLLLFKE